ncbi:glycosyltransferase family 2 protein [Mariniflexile aquimaris]|uniref:Glycosyltransferase family 2 protein n=1 Tax=Mariniflexile aquimaris TaxID=881009 RepID=A0ABW3BUZ4_9FLAO
MKVSVIIPTYKRSKYLIRAIESVLNQDFKNIEIIVVDDNGMGIQQEETKLIVKKYPEVKLITYDKNKGGCYARNKGAEEATGDILMFLDDDDYFFKDKVRKHIAPLIEDPKLAMSLCYVKITDEAGNNIENTLKYAKGDSLKSFILNGHIFTLMMAIKTDIFRSIGGFENIPRFQDQYFMYKFFSYNYKVEFVKEELLVVVEHENNRVSKQNIQNESIALNALYTFEKENFKLFNKEDQRFLRNRHFEQMASIRSKGSFKDRIAGIKYLVKSNSVYGFENSSEKVKILMRLALTDKFYYKLKNTFRI